MTAPTDVPVLDHAEGLRRAGGNERLRKELVAVFLLDLPRLTRLVEDALAQKSAQALGHAAHSLKGSASQIGASALAARAGILEQLARNHDLREADLHQSLLADELQLLSIVLQDEPSKPTV